MTSELQLTDLEGPSTERNGLEVLAQTAIEEGASLRKLGKYFGIEDQNYIAKLRARILELKFDCDLSHIAGKQVDFNKMDVPDENFIGFTQVPTGCVGPVKVKARHLEIPELTYLLSTTEQSLIAGANAAAKIVNEAGGIVVKAYPDTNKLARSSAFTFHGNDDSPYLEYIQELLDEKKTIQRIIREGYGNFKGSEYAEFTDGFVISEEDFIFIRYNIWPGDAAGHNMVTKVAHILNSYITDEMKKDDLPLDHLILSGGLCKDKNVAAINIDRGIKVNARVVLPHDVCKKYSIDPERTQLASYAKNYVAQSLAGGMRGNNSSVANPYTAMAIAYGQDVANAIEASQTRTSIRNVEGGLQYSVTGNIVCGTLGGGTKWSCQKEALEMLGLYGSDPDNPGLYKARFAEVMATSFLLSELAVHRSLMTGSEGAGSRHFKSHNGKMRK